MRLKTVAFVAGFIFLSIGFIMWIVLIAGGHSGLPLVQMAFLLSGAGFLVYDRVKVAQLERLMGEGICYDARIVNLTRGPAEPVKIIRIGSFRDSYVDCRYINETGNEYCVRSRWFLWDSSDWQGLNAKVYVDRENPEKYAVHIVSKEDIS